MPHVYNHHQKKLWWWCFIIVQIPASFIHSFIMRSRLFLLGRIALLVLINSIPLAQFVDGGPVISDLWDLGTTSSLDADVGRAAGLWSADSSTDADLFTWPEFSDSTFEYDDDLLLAANPPCRADADLTQFEPYSKLRARKSCPAGKPTPPLALPSLEQLGGPDDGSGSGSVGVGELNNIFNILPLSPAETEEDENLTPTCPSDRTFTSKIPVCDSGKMTDSHTLTGFAYSTLYNVQLCGSHHAALASALSD